MIGSHLGNARVGDDANDPGHRAPRLRKRRHHLADSMAGSRLAKELGNCAEEHADRRFPKLLTPILNGHRYFKFEAAASIFNFKKVIGPLQIRDPKKGFIKFEVALQKK